MRKWLKSFRITTKVFAGLSRILNTRETVNYTWKGPTGKIFRHCFYCKAWQDNVRHCHNRKHLWHGMLMTSLMHPICPPAWQSLECLLPHVHFDPFISLRPSHSDSTILFSIWFEMSVHLFHYETETVIILRIDDVIPNFSMRGIILESKVFCDMTSLFHILLFHSSNCLNRLFARVAREQILY